MEGKSVPLMARGREDYACKNRESGHVTQVVTLMGVRMVMLQRWSL